MEPASNNSRCKVVSDFVIFPFCFPFGNGLLRHGGRNSGRKVCTTGQTTNRLSATCQSFPLITIPIFPITESWNTTIITICISLGPSSYNLFAVGNHSGNHNTVCSCRLAKPHQRWSKQCRYRAIISQHHLLPESVLCYNRFNRLNCIYIIIFLPFLSYLGFITVCFIFSLWSLCPAIEYIRLTGKVGCIFSWVFFED